MNTGMWIAKTGIDAQQTRVSVISNNLANANTNGYKKGRGEFEDLLYQTVRQPGGLSSQDTTLPSGLMMGTGVRAVAVQKLFSQGNIVQTNNPLDMAIGGQGFFQVVRPDGTTAYTRDGAFQMSADREMVTSSGYLLEPAITIPVDAISVTIGVDGVVSVVSSSGPGSTQVGNIDLVSFPNPAGLEPTGQSLYLETAASGTPTQGTPGEDGLGQLAQNAIETSNVNVSEELVNMIEAQRAFEANSKVIATVDQMLQFLNNTV